MKSYIINEKRLREWVSGAYLNGWDRSRDLLHEDYSNAERCAAEEAGEIIAILDEEDAKR